jgi:hypothetical protein
MACVVLGVAVTALYPGSYFEDPAIHFLRARWMWTHPWMAVDVWDRPLFTLVYSIPAKLPASGFASYVAAKLTTVAISAATAWFTFELARAYRLERPALVIPLLWLQPCVFLLSSETTPEPLFALLLVIALVLRQRGKVVAALMVASALTLVRPEGFLLLPLWAWWAATDARSPHSKRGRFAVICALAIAPALWWYLAAQITLDPLFPIHNWPALFIPLRTLVPLSRDVLHKVLQNDAARWSEVLGIALVIPFAVGLWVTLRRREIAFATALVIAVFCGQLLGGRIGFFGWAPVPSAYVCVGPAIALAILAGWNAIGNAFSSVKRFRLLRLAAGLTLMLALVGDVVFADGQPGSREWRPIRDAMSWFSGHPQPVTNFVWSRAYADVLAAHDPLENPLRFGDRPGAVAAFAAAGPATLVQWDDRVGPSSYGLSAPDIEATGFATLYHTADALHGWLPSDSSSRAMAGARSLLRIAPDQVHHTETWLLYRQATGSRPTAIGRPQSVAR